MCVALTWAPTDSQAQFSKFRGAAGVKMDVEYTTFDDPDAMALPSDTVAGGLDLWGTIGSTAQFLAAIDLRFGGAVEGGFSYEMDLYPFGLGLQLGTFGFIGVAGGIGFSGVTGQIPFARQIPVRAMIQLNLHERLQVEGFGVGKFIGARARTDGAEHLGFDEIKAGALIRVGKGGSQRYNKWGNGYYVGATYSELLGVRSYSMLIGYSISLFYDPSGRFRQRNRRPYMPRVRPPKPDDAPAKPTVSPPEL